MELDQIIERARSDWGTVGLAVAAVRGDEVVYARGFGFRELGRPGRVDADTLFQVGSTTKAVTAAALGMLVEEGRLSWDDAIIDYVPAFRLQDPWITRSATVRDAVAHRCGVSDSFYYALRPMQSEEAIAQLRHLPLKGAFRDSFIYSNLMYAVAGAVLEATSGMSWHQFMKERLFGPLQMHRSATSAYQFWDAQWVAPTFFGAAPAGIPSESLARDTNIAMPHGWGRDGSVSVLPWQSFDHTAAAGSLISSANDMANWLAVNITQGEFRGERIMKPGTVHDLHAIHNLHSGAFRIPCDADRDGYAMGWWRGRHRDHVQLSHGGNMIGSPAHVAILPNPRLGVVVLANGPKYVRDDFTLHKAVTHWVFDYLLKERGEMGTYPFRDWFRRASTERDRELQELTHWRRPSVPPSVPLPELVGSFEDPLGQSGELRIALQDDQLNLRFTGEGAFCATLEHWHANVFRLRSGPGVEDMLDALGPQFVTFTIDASARVASLSAFGAFGGTFVPRASSS